jgi:hypothetical protein
MYHAIVFLPLIGALIAGLSAARSAPRPANRHHVGLPVIAAHPVLDRLIFLGFFATGGLHACR